MCRYIEYFLLNLVFLGVSPAATVYFFSGVGEGATVYVELQKCKAYKEIFTGIAVLLALLLYLGDLCVRPPPAAQKRAGGPAGPGAAASELFPTVLSKALLTLAVLSATVAWLFWLDKYPSAPLLMLQLVLMGFIIFLGTLAPVSSSGSATVPASQTSVTYFSLQSADRRDTFNTAQVSALLTHGLWTLFLWFFWVADSPVGDGAQGWNESTRERFEKQGINSQNFGTSMGSVMLYLWMSPAIASMVLCTAAAVVMFTGSLQRQLRGRPQVSACHGDPFKFKIEGTTPSAAEDDGKTACAELSASEKAKVGTLVYMVKMLTAAFVVLFGVAWVTAAVVGSSLSIASTVQAFTAVFAGFLVVYVYLALAGETRAIIARAAETSPLMKSAKSMLVSDWARAALLGVLFCVFPFYLMLSFLNQRIRRCRGAPKAGWFTARVEQQLAQLRLWPWTGIYRKLQMLCILAVGLQVVGGMGTNIFLAWVNSKLQSTGFFPLAVIFFMVGTGMFMIPIVPGIAVYLFGGILVPAGFVREYGTANDYSDQNFWFGFLVAVLLNFSLKMLAIVLQQKGIGEPMSTNLSVLQVVGANTPQMKAIEKILRLPGFGFPKIVILCGGPDWPTSVLTGILRLSLPQMLLGSIPVILNVLLVTAAGCFRLRQTGSATWSAMSSVALTVASVWTVLQMALAGYYIQEAWETHHESLSKPRREHLQLDWLDHVVKQQNTVKDAFMDWRTLHAVAKVVIFVGTALMLFSSFFMVMLQSRCWDNFEVTDDIAELGLHFIRAEGWIAICVFGAGCLQYFAVTQWVQCRTRRECRAIADKMAPERNDWIALRANACEAPEEKVLQENLPSLVLDLQKELQELRKRVSTLELQAAQAAQAAQARPQQRAGAEPDGASVAGSENVSEV